MKSVGIILIALIISGLEPFLSLGSPIIALSAVLGAKYPKSGGIFAAVLIGLVRDALLVNRLGISSLIAAFAWGLAALAATRLGRPQAVSIIAAGLAASAAATDYRFILATAVLAGVFSFVWNFISERDETIKIRKN